MGAPEQKGGTEKTNAGCVPAYGSGPNPWEKKGGKHGGKKKREEMGRFDHVTNKKKRGGGSTTTSSSTTLRGWDGGKIEREKTRTSCPKRTKKGKKRSSLRLPSVRSVHRGHRREKT